MAGMHTELWCIELDGFDMLPVLRGEQPSPRAEMFWQRRGDKAARVGDWKWVESSRGHISTLHRRCLTGTGSWPQH